MSEEEELLARLVRCKDIEKELETVEVHGWYSEIARKKDCYTSMYRMRGSDEPREIMFITLSTTNQPGLMINYPDAKYVGVLSNCHRNGYVGRGRRGL